MRWKHLYKYAGSPDNRILSKDVRGSDMLILANARDNDNNYANAKAR